MKPATSATPMIALSAVAVDTETTGLDVTKALIVQIGAVGIAGGKLVPAPPFEMLVDPGEPIPEAASRIHGITNDRLEGAPQFSTAWTAFRKFASARVLIGYSIGFDLAMLERECRRAGLPWDRPRSLCVRLLAMLVDPCHANHSLDMLADWFGIELSGRHSAIGDAIAAAEIFLALLPELRSRGIRTLGEAEAACLTLSHALEAGHHANWAEPVSHPQIPAFSHVDPFAYLHRVSDLMSHPPVVVKPAQPIRQMVDLMASRRISSVLVADHGEPDHPIADYGIVTERDVMRWISARGAEALSLPVGDIASHPLASVREHAYAYRAIGRMERLKIRHLAVRDEKGLLVGVLSARDLLRLRASAAISLDDTIEHAEDAAGLAAAWAMLPGVVRSLVAEEIDPRIVAEIISEELRAVTRRASLLGERAMEEDAGGAPCAYAVLVLGSGGRGESLLAPDQDNAIVFAGGESQGVEDRWFGTLGGKLADILDTAGIPYCKGGVMARNPEFRGSLDTWKQRVEGWVRRSRPEDLLNVDIVYDLRPVHGDVALADMLFDFAYQRGQEEPAFAKLLGEQVTPGSPFTLFGNFQLEEGRVDLKKHGLFPIVAAARTLAIKHDIRARSTRERLEGLIALGIGGEHDLEAMRDGHAFLLGLVLAQQSRDLLAGVPVSNRLDTSTLSRDQRDELKTVLKHIQSVLPLVRDLMFS